MNLNTFLCITDKVFCYAKYNIAKLQFYIELTSLPTQHFNNLIDQSNYTNILVVQSYKIEWDKFVYYTICLYRVAH